LLGDTGFWALVLCLLGLWACLEPFSPWGELEVVDRNRISHQLAAVPGYMCVAGIVAGCLYLVLCCVFLVAGLPERPPRWRAPLLILAGVNTAAFTASTLLLMNTHGGKQAISSGTTKATAETREVTRKEAGNAVPKEQPEVRFREPVAEGVKLLGIPFSLNGHFSVDAGRASLAGEVAGRDFLIKEDAWMAHDPGDVIVVKGIPRNHPLRVIKATVNIWPYLVMGSGILLLFIGCIDLRRAWAPRH
jgi:hypothetical protein